MQFKKILSIILTLILTMGICPAVFATDNIPEGFTPIYTAEDLNNVRNNLSGKYILMNDIDLSEIEWMPIGTELDAFKGVLDGNGKTLNGLNITGTVASVNRNSSGFFAFTNGATIKNININNAQTKIAKTEDDFYSVGIIVGLAKFSTIENCKVYGKSDVSVKGTLNIGGVIGEAFNTVDISKCENNVEIIANAKDEINIGGIVGSSDSIISLSANKATITADNSNSDEPKSDAIYVGGICGNMFLNEIKNCYNTGDIQLNILSDSAKAGGIAGTSLYISSCYNIGYIEYNNQEPSYYTGGIVGIANDNSFADIKINYCYCLDNISKAIGNEEFTSIYKVKILSESEMKNQSSYVGFDFENIWIMGESGYLVLRESVEPENPPEEPIKYLTEAEIIKVPLGKRIVFGYYPESPEGIEIKLTYSNGDIITDTVRLSDDGNYYVGTEIVLEEKNIMLPLGNILTYGINKAEYFLGNENVPIAYKYLALPSIVEFFRNIFN